MDAGITLGGLVAVGGFLLTLIGFAFGVWKYVEGKVDRARSDAVLRAEAASIRAESVERELAAYKTHAAETFATKAGLTESLGRVHDALDRLTDRIDALIASQPKRATRSST